MIAKGQSTIHLKDSINSLLGQGGIEILDKNIVSETAKGVVEEFLLFQQWNDRCKCNVLSFFISPTIEDSKRLSNDDLEKINKSFLEKMKLEDHQYIAFLNKNTERKYIHLYVNRISYEGKVFDDGFVGKRSSQVAEHIANEMGLTSAKQVQEIRQKERALQHPEMEKIKELAQATLRVGGVNSVSDFIAIFNKAGAKVGFLAEAYHNKSGAFQGLRFYAGEHRFKASEIAKSLSKRNLEYHFEMLINPKL